MDLKVEKGDFESRNYFEDYSRKSLEKLFAQYDFIKSVNVFFRGKKHPTKKVKIKARFKGKEVFVEESAENYQMAVDGAIKKLKVQVEKYKTKHYKRSVAEVPIESPAEIIFE